MSEQPNMVTTLGDVRRRWDIFAAWFEQLGIREDTPVEIVQEKDHFRIRPVPQAELRAHFASTIKIIANAFDAPPADAGPGGS